MRRVIGELLSVIKGFAQGVCRLTPVSRGSEDLPEKAVSPPPVKPERGSLFDLDGSAHVLLSLKEVPQVEE